MESTLEIQEERPNRKVYRITPAGRAELQRWLQTEQPLPVHREPLLVQLFFAGQLDNATILRHIEYQRAAHQVLLDRYHAIPMPTLDDPDLDRERTVWRLTLEMGIAMEQMYLDWLRQCEEVVGRLDQHTTS